MFIINGRSGSDAPRATLSTLAGSNIGENTGENKVQEMDFLGRMPEEEGAEVLVSALRLGGDCVTG